MPVGQSPVGQSPVVAALSSLPPPGSGSQTNLSQGVVDSGGDVKSEEGDSEDDHELYHGLGDQTINLKRGRPRGRCSQGKDDHRLASILWLLPKQISGVATTELYDRELKKKCNIELKYLIVNEHGIKIYLTTTLSGVSPAFKTPSMKAPVSFDGSNPSKLRNFLQSCQLIFYNNEKTFSKDKKKVLYAASFLSGKAGKWIEPYLTQLDNMELTYILNLWTSFETQLFTLFGNPNKVRKAEQEINHLRMKDHGMASSYILDLEPSPPRLALLSLVDPCYDSIELIQNDLVLNF
ncbi:hypothetical protein BY996DRAFT_6586376 [Phakopsora pachyrhizi]|nr:hypothetical protein BY996DRAFT_6586376 [Phakopsora pachyrhizi]